MTLQMTVPTSALNFGTCWGTPNGQDLSMPSYMASGYQCVAEAIARRWSTTRGQLIYDPNYGYNAMDLVSADLTPADLQYAQQQFAVEAQKDERVQRAQVKLDLSIQGLLTVNAVITTKSGPFRLVLAVNQVSVTILLVKP